MPYISQVAVGRRKQLAVYGGDWPTIDGTGVRDYIHVMDLARAHADALEFMLREDAWRWQWMNPDGYAGSGAVAPTERLAVARHAMGRPRPVKAASLR